MPDLTIREILITRDHLTPEEADELIDEARAAIEEIVESTENPVAGLLDCEQVIQDYFGLEPDYLNELLPF